MRPLGSVTRSQALQGTAVYIILILQPTPTKPPCYAVRYRVPQCTSKWARYIDKEIIVKPLLPYKSHRVFT